MVRSLGRGPDDGMFENPWRLDQGPDQPGADLVDVYVVQVAGRLVRISQPLVVGRPDRVAGKQSLIPHFLNVTARVVVSRRRSRPPGEQSAPRSNISFRFARRTHSACGDSPRLLSHHHEARSQCHHRPLDRCNQECFRPSTRFCGPQANRVTFFSRGSGSQGAAAPAVARPRSAASWRRPRRTSMGLRTHGSGDDITCGGQRGVIPT